MEAKPSAAALAGLDARIRLVDAPSRPMIGVPLGDPGGVGPEIAVQAALSPVLRELGVQTLLIGGPHVVDRTIRLLQAAGIALPDGDILVYSVPEADLETSPYGRVSAEGGRAAYACIAASATLALDGRIDAVATTPINKESIRAAGIDSIGHTEMYAALTGTKNPMTLFQTLTLRVFFLTRHVSLAKACTLVTEDRVAEGIRDSVEGLRSLGIDPSSAPLAVAGLNPHNGEHGLFGDEEGRFVEPAVARCRAEGISVVGPVPADSVFHQALHGRYSAVLSLYHDQGHIATKTLDFERTISLTLGMPFLRTSVDHGTAFDIAGTAAASPVSMIEAVRLGALYGPAYTAYSNSRR